MNKKINKQFLPQIVLILKIPPPYGGGEIRAKYLKKYFDSNNKYSIIYLSRKSNNKSTQGQLLLRNFYWGAYLITKTIFSVLKFQPEVIYTSLPKDLKWASGSGRADASR